MAVVCRAIHSPMDACKGTLDNLNSPKRLLPT